MYISTASVIDLWHAQWEFRPPTDPTPNDKVFYDVLPLLLSPLLFLASPCVDRAAVKYHLSFRFFSAEG